MKLCQDHFRSMKLLVMQQKQTQTATSFKLLYAVSTKMQILDEQAEQRIPIHILSQRNSAADFPVR